MGVDTRLFINGKYEIEEIKSVIERKFETKVKVEATHSPNYHILEFEVSDVEHRRMNVHTASNFAGFSGTLLTLGYSGSAVKIMQSIGEVFGGFLNEADTHENYTRISGKLSESDALPFFVRYAIVSGVDHRDPDKLAEFVKATQASWNKKPEGF
jgi:hypothetical protein